MNKLSWSWSLVYFFCWLAGWTDRSDNNAISAFNLVEVEVEVEVEAELGKNFYTLISEISQTLIKEISENLN